MGSIGNTITIPDTRYTNAQDFRKDLENYFTLDKGLLRGEYRVTDVDGVGLGVIRFGKDLGYSTVNINNGTDYDGHESWTAHNNLKSAVNALRKRRR